MTRDEFKALKIGDRVVYNDGINDPEEGFLRWMCKEFCIIELGYGWCGDGGLFYRVYLSEAAKAEAEAVGEINLANLEGQR